jgi:Na+-transporting NADH:ubiquinone oxidoreductase subunit NqrB
VAAVLLTVQVLGQTVLGFRLSVAQILISLATGALVEFGVAFFKDRAIMWPASGLLTGNSAAIILRVPGTLHGQWWSLHGIWIFIGVVAISMASKYLIRWRGRHIFNPSNLGLVLAFVALGPRFTEPMDLWWIPMGQWLIVTYAVLIVGGLLIAWELRLLGLELGFMAGFAAFTALALALVPDHCMVASWHVAPMCGRTLWQILVASPEILVFALFMIPDPRTVPDGPVARVAFGIVVAILSVLLLGPTSLEFWTKTAILASLVIACGLRFALARFLVPLEAGNRRRRAGTRGRPGWRLATGLAVGLLFVSSLPVAADLSTHSPEPAPGLADGSTPTLALTVGAGPAIAGWVSGSAGAALPPPRNLGPASASGHLWILPPIPTVTVAPNVLAFDQTASSKATKMAHDVVLDLIIESEARRAHDVQLAGTAAAGEALQEFVDVIKQDIRSGKVIQKTYSFDKVSLNLFLPKYSSQASRLIGVTLHGTGTLTTLDASGHVLSQTSTPYSKSWGLDGALGADHQLIINNYTDLAPAP